MQPASVILQAEALCLVSAVARAVCHRHRRPRRPDPKWLRILLDRLRQMSQR